jgi:hypothetical protein
MSGHRLVPLALVVLCALTSIQLTGCTAIGFGVGALSDMSNGKRTPDRLDTMRTGTGITLWLRDGRKLHGRFLGSCDSLSESSPPVRPTSGDQSGAPLRAVLLIGTGHGVRQIPIQDVSRVSVPVARGKVIGLFTGLSVDTLMFLLFLAALSQFNFS